MATNEELRYEVNDRGDRVVVKSLESRKKVYLRFTNRSSRPVDIWWRDFQGVKKYYARLKPRSHYDVNSFITHPWEFIDPATKENFVVNNKVIFRAPGELGGVMFRTNWIISTPVRTLKDTSLLCLAILTPNQEAASCLGLPEVVVRDLRSLMDTIRNNVETVGDVR